MRCFYLGKRGDNIVFCVELWMNHLVSKLRIYIRCKISLHIFWIMETWWMCFCNLLRTLLLMLSLRDMESRHLLSDLILHYEVNLLRIVYHFMKFTYGKILKKNLLTKYTKVSLLKIWVSVFTTYFIKILYLWSNHHTKSAQ